jgi:hypothetical protein
MPSGGGHIINVLLKQARFKGSIIAWLLLYEPGSVAELGTKASFP